MSLKKKIRDFNVYLYHNSIVMETPLIKHLCSETFIVCVLPFFFIALSSSSRMGKIACMYYEHRYWRPVFAKALKFAMSGGKDEWF